MLRKTPELFLTEACKNMNQAVCDMVGNNGSVHGNYYGDDCFWKKKKRISVIWETAGFIGFPRGIFHRFPEIMC